MDKFSELLKAVGELKSRGKKAGSELNKLTVKRKDLQDKLQTLIILDSHDEAKQTKKQLNEVNDKIEELRATVFLLDQEKLQSMIKDHRPDIAQLALSVIQEKQAAIDELQPKYDELRSKAEKLREKYLSTISEMGKIYTESENLARHGTEAIKYCQSGMINVKPINTGLTFGDPDKPGGGLNTGVIFIDEDLSAATFKGVPYARKIKHPPKLGAQLRHD